MDNQGLSKKGFCDWVRRMPPCVQRLVSSPNNTDRQKMTDSFPPWKRLLLYALGTAGVSLLYAAGYRGKYRPAVSPYSWQDTILVFLFVFVSSFFVYYLCWLLERFWRRVRSKDG